VSPNLRGLCFVKRVVKFDFLLARSAVTAFRRILRANPQDAMLCRSFSGRSRGKLGPKSNKSTWLHRLLLRPLGVFAKFKPQSLISSNHGNAFFGRRGWDAGRTGAFFDWVHHGLPGGIFSGESGERGGVVLEFLRGKHVWDYAGADAAGRGNFVLERAKRDGLDCYGGGCALYSGRRDRQHEHLFSADEPVQYFGDAGFAGWRAWADCAGVAFAPCG